MSPPDFRLLVLDNLNTFAARDGQQIDSISFNLLMLWAHAAEDYGFNPAQFKIHGPDNRIWRIYDCGEGEYNYEEIT